MAFLSYLVFGGVVLSVLISTMMKIAMLECDTYRIPRQSSSKIILITGGNSGLGYHTAAALAGAGAHVVLACRNLDKCNAAKDLIVGTGSSASVDTMVLDLSSFKSVKSFSKAFKNKYDHLDVLVNNAGIMAVPERELTEDGLELQIGTNHFGHFLLTSLLFPLISKNGRIVNHSSGAHAMAESSFPFDDMLSEKSYSAWGAYGNSKAANLMFTYELNRRILEAQDQEDNNVDNANANRSIISVAVHPGYTATNLQTDKMPFWEQLNYLFAMKGIDGALSQIEAAVGPDVQRSMDNYIGPRYVMLGAPAVSGTYGVAKNAEAAKYLWSESVRLTGAEFSFN